MEIKLSQGEVNNYAEDIYKIIKDIPIYYLNEIVENALEERKKEGEVENIDYISSSDEEEEEEVDSESDISTCESDISTCESESECD